MKRLGLLSIALVTAVTVACNGNGRNTGTSANTNANQTVGTSGSANAPDVSRSDRNFVTDMLAGGNREIELSKVAERKAASPQVKRFAQMMVEQHTKAGDQLKQIAASYNIQPDTSKDEDKYKDDMDKLSKLQGSDFDREYMSMMIDDHKDAVDSLNDRTKENNNATVGTSGTSAEKNTNVQPEKANNHVDASLNQWAADTLPTVQHHLDDAKQIDQQLNNNRRNRTATQAAPNGGKAKY